MEYQKITNLLDNTTTQPSKFRTKDWGEVNDGARRTYNTSSQITFRTTIFNVRFNNTCLLVKGTITPAAKASSASNRDNKLIIFKNCSPFTDSISEINNTQVDYT